MSGRETPYEGEHGEAYLSQRKAATSAHNQNLRAGLFRDLSGSDRTVLDFGCGTGGVLSRLAAKRRIGIEVGEAAASEARRRGIETFTDLHEVPDHTADVAISFHAIEHVERPIEVLREIARVVKPDGLIRLIVPGELATDPNQRHWYPNSDLHLHTWTPLLFGNLAHYCGYEEIRTQIQPMPTGSRLVRGLALVPPLSRAAHWHLSKRRNALNVVLDARPPSASRRG